MNGGIPERKQTKNCDLVIMGNRGRGALKSLFMGSVSSHLASNVKCPILIIK